MTDPAEVSSREKPSSEDVQIVQGDSGGTVTYVIEGEIAVVTSLSGDTSLTEEDLARFKANNPDLVDALESDSVIVPTVEDKTAALEPTGRAS